MLWLWLTKRTLPAQMKVIHFEIWKEGIKVKNTLYEDPLTREEALSALQEEDPQWRGKLTAKDSQVGLRGPGNLDSSKIHVLWLADSPGRRSSIL